MSLADLKSALDAVDWRQNIIECLQHVTTAELMDKSSHRIAVWAKQFEQIEHTNPAICFVREMQAAGQHVSVLVALALYKPAAAAMRTMLESALYYSYFRTHPAELETLVRDPSFYVDKADVLEYHKVHSPDFHNLAAALGFNSGLKTWYSGISAVVHGQLPGKWVEAGAIASIKHSKLTHAAAIDTFCKGEALVHQFFLCATGRHLWSGFAPDAKKFLLKGLPGPHKAILALDSA